MNGVIVVDKPQGWTSHDVVAKLRGILKQKRVGHGGTLDPMATGVLPVFVGRATRAAQFCESADKEYIAGIKLGVTTDTQDITGTVLEKRHADVSEEEFKRALSRFEGEIEQLPPMYSALKINGKKLYELARAGKTVERKPRKLEIKEIEYLGSEAGGEYKFRVVCSKGTYVRTLCNDIGDFLGCGGAMSYLRRIRAGEFAQEASFTLEEISDAVEKQETERVILPVDRMFAGYEGTTAESERELKAVYNGGGYKTELPDGMYRVYDKNGIFLMLGRAENGFMITVKNFFEVR